jgi:hypothetical protein
MHDLSGSVIGSGGDLNNRDRPSSLGGRTMSLSVRMQRIVMPGLAIVALMASSLTSCNKSDQVVTQKTFATPEEAGQAVLQAAQSGNSDTLLSIFGPTSKNVIYSGDVDEDKKSLQNFASAYDAMHRWRKLDSATQLLLVGVDNNAFPIPLKMNTAERWYFDTNAGKEELNARRIGENELATILVCKALASAQREYFSGRHDDVGPHAYALKFISSNGKHDGLYWEPHPDGLRSPIGPLVAFATKDSADAGSNHQPYRGYYFRMLDKQGSHASSGAKDYIVKGQMTNGFALVAFPAEYGVTGVMTFVVNQDGVIYQKDLGESTERAEAGINEFDPDQSWSAVD